MCVFPGSAEHEEGFSGNTRKAWGQCGQQRAPGRKILPERHQLPGEPDDFRCKKPRFYWVFSDGTALADQSAWKKLAALCGICWSSAMFFALGAASTALDAIQSLTSSKLSSPKATGFSEAGTDPFSISSNASTSASSTAPSGTSGATGFSQISPATMSALLAAQNQASAGATTSASTSPSSALQDLFSQIDANGDGQISKSEFENALGAGGTNIAQADNVFNKLDTNGDGSVSLSEMSSALKGAGGKGHHRHAQVGGSSGSGSTDAGSNADTTTGTAASSSDPLLQALLGSSGISVLKSDGYTGMSTSPGDGSAVIMMAPSTTTSSTATSSYNLMEQLIQREANAYSFSPTSLSYSA
jgi:Ca2+-binding EF-hand superfamily protein